MNNTREWSMAPPRVLILDLVLVTLGLINIPHTIVLCINAPGKYRGSINNRKLLLTVAVLDIIATLIKIPLDNTAVQDFMERERWFCAITTLGYGFALSTECMLMIGCMDRLAVIKLGAKYSSSVVGKHFGKFLTIPMVYYGALLILINSLYMDEILRPRGISFCYFEVTEKKLVQVSFMLGVILPVLVTVGSYIAIVVLIKKNDGNKNKKNAMFSYRIATYIMVVTVLQVVCWSPQFIHLIMGIRGQFSWTVFHAAPITVAVNSFIRPLLYGLMNGQYRRLLYKTLCLREDGSRRFWSTSSASSPSRPNSS